MRSTGDCQMVLVDLPGVQRPRDALTERMAQRVRQELEGCDAALMVLNGEQGVGPGDRFIAQALAGASAAVTIAVNKADRLTRAETIEVLGAGRRARGCPRMSSRSRRAPGSAWRR